MDKIVQYYSRPEIQQAILEIVQDREVAVKYGEQGYGKRPDVLQYASDIKHLAQEGATSFHISEERWSNPLLLQTGMSRKQLDELRIGFDLVFDIDCPYLEYSKKAAHLLVEALKIHNISSYGIKYSGNKGFHILVPFETLPSMVNNVPTQLLFPELPQLVISYIKYLIKDHLAKELLEMSTLQEIADGLQKKVEDLKEGGSFNPYKVLEIDTILISSRHLFRCLYSINEKTGLVSIPIDERSILPFKPSSAKLPVVDVGVPYFKKVQKPEAEMLIAQSYDFQKKYTLVQPHQEQRMPKEKSFSRISEQKVDAKFFPPCIQKCLLGLKEDGRKRGVFILINFLKSMQYSMDEIKEMLLQWNAKNYQPLKDGYILSQLAWHKRQKEIIPPPNCSNEAYYKSLGIKCDEKICSRFRNPVNYVKAQLQQVKEQEQKKGKKKKTS